MFDGGSRLFGWGSVNWVTASIGGSAPHTRRNPRSRRADPCFAFIASHSVWAGIARIAYFYKLRDFEKRFDTMGVEELKRCQVYWTQHAQGLAPKVRKLAMKRVHDIERAIERRSGDQSDD